MSFPTQITFAVTAILVFGTLLDALTESLNLRALRDSLPPEFEGVFDPEKYRASIAYQREGTRFGLLQGFFVTAALIAFILLRGFGTVDRFARHFGWGLVATGLLFAGVVSLLRWAVQLPFQLYDTFVIEEKFGFNRMTAATYVSDLLKGLLLAVMLGAPALGVVLFFFEKAGPEAWLYSWIALTVFQLLLAYLAPAVILPLFNRFTPLAAGEVRSEIEAYARKENFRLEGIYTMDSSKRSTKSNAFFTGFGRFRRLVLFDTLLERQTPEELVAVVAHEVGHFRRRHILQFMALSIATSGALFFALSLLIGSEPLARGFGVERASIYANLVFLGFLYSPVYRVLSIFTHALSRSFEFQADEFSIETYGRPMALVSALKKLSADNMSHLTPHRLKVVLDYTHPPVLARIGRIRRLTTRSAGDP